MSTQLLIVTLLIAAAGAYFGVVLFRKARSFSPGTDCGDNCGCGDKAPTKIKH